MRNLGLSMHAESPEIVVEKIERAFSQVQFPGLNNLVIGNRNDDEVIGTKLVFERITNWHSVDPLILDTAPDGLASALSFFSPIGFHFFIPAFMIADLMGKLRSVDPTFFLCIHLTELKTPDGVTLETDLNRKFPNEAVERLSAFNREQCKAIASYLTVIALRCDDDCALECASLWETMGRTRSVPAN